MMNDVKINKARALYYSLFSRFFVFTTDNKRYLELVNLIDILKENPLDSTSKQAFEDIKELVKSDSNIALMNEFDDIFHSPETRTVRTTASYYDENIESGKKRVEMQNFLAKTKIRRDEKKYSDYEDHIGFIFSVLSELTNLQAQGEVQYSDTVHCIFAQILNEFVDEFSKEVYEHESANIFKNVIVILNAFIEFERVYLEVSKPTIVTKSSPKKEVENISEEELARRARNKAMKANGPKNKEDESCPVHIAYDVEDDI
ncbi:MAG: TorD/DmsD family molecular chaperone [Halarcobacter sp.]